MGALLLSVALNRGGENKIAIVHLMENRVIGLLLRPLVLFILVACFTRPVARLVFKHMKEGRLKRFLLIPLGESRRLKSQR
jgi:hypothetical protein